MALFRYGRDLDPLNALSRLQQELERTFDSPFGHGLGLLGRGVHPAINIFKSGEDVVLRIEVPGFAPEDLGVTSQGQTLIVSGKPAAQPQVTGSYHRRERATGEFSRSIQTPREVDPARATAQCKHGVLTIRVPAREEVKPRQISITGG
ncbi:MAG: Hsp20/alpha crystallin family protein [Myxococcota bacterium]